MDSFAERVIQGMSVAAIDFSQVDEAKTRAWMASFRSGNVEAGTEGERRARRDPLFEEILVESGLDRRRAA